MSITHQSTHSSETHAVGAEPDDRLVEHRIHRGELVARTDAGRRFVSAAEELVEPLAASAPGHDRDGSYPFDPLELVRASGLPGHLHRRNPAAGVSHRYTT
jgi:hypothetical protein